MRPQNCETKCSHPFRRKSIQLGHCASSINCSAGTICCRRLPNAARRSAPTLPAGNSAKRSLLSLGSIRMFHMISWYFMSFAQHEASGRRRAGACVASGWTEEPWGSAFANPSYDKWAQVEVCCKPAGRVIGIPIGTFWMLQYMIENIWFIKPSKTTAVLLSTRRWLWLHDGQKQNGWIEHLGLVGFRLRMISECGIPQPKKAANAL